MTLYRKLYSYFKKAAHIWCKFVFYLWIYCLPDIRDALIYFWFFAGINGIFRFFDWYFKPSNLILVKDTVRLFIKVSLHQKDGFSSKERFILNLESKIRKHVLWHHLQQYMFIFHCCETKKKKLKEMYYVYTANCLYYKHIVSKHDGYFCNFSCTKRVFVATIMKVIVIRTNRKTTREIWQLFWAPILIIKAIDLLRCTQHISILLSRHSRTMHGGG